MMLSEVIPSVSEMSRLKSRLDEAGYDIRGHHFFAGMGTNGTKTYPEEVDRLIRLFRQLTNMGVLVKDIDRGLIDFPSIRESGEEVYLCYLLGESTIDYWHGIEEGFAGRQPVDAL